MQNKFSIFKTQSKDFLLNSLATSSIGLVLSITDNIASWRRYSPRTHFRASVCVGLAFAGANLLLTSISQPKSSAQANDLNPSHRI